MSSDDTQTHSGRCICSCWILSSGENATWVCKECGRSDNDVSFIIPYYEVKIDEPR